MNIDDDSTLMMSDSLRDSIPVSELIKYQNSIILCVVFIAVGDAVEEIVGNVVSHRIREGGERIELRVTIADAFGLTDAWPKIDVQKYELRFSDNVITFPGPYRVVSLETKEVDFERQMCVLVAKLRRD